MSGLGLALTPRRRRRLGSAALTPLPNFADRRWYRDNGDDTPSV